MTIPGARLVIIKSRNCAMSLAWADKCLFHTDTSGFVSEHGVVLYAGSYRFPPLFSSWRGRSVCDGEEGGSRLSVVPLTARKHRLVP